MSEKTETPEKKAPVKPRPKKQRDGSSGAFLAMVIALAAGGGSYYVWQQHLIAEQDRRALEQSIQQLLEVVEEKDRAQQARIEQLQAHRHDPVEQRLQALEQSLPDLSQQLSLQQQEWGLAEVDYLLRLADHRLQLSHDIPTAIAALGQAREQLVTYTNGDFSDVISTIEENINSLSQVSQQGTAHINAKLSEVLAKLDALPFAIEASEAPKAQPAPPPPSETAKLGERIKQWGRIVWHDIKALVTIRRSDEISRPLMNAEQRYFLQAQLRIKLETARLAAMGQNHALYGSSLKEAADWLSRYYDSNDTDVVTMYATINELATLSVDSPLPSLQPLRQQLHSQRPPAQPAAPQPTTLAPPHTTEEPAVEGMEAIPMETAPQPAAGEEGQR